MINTSITEKNWESDSTKHHYKATQLEDGTWRVSKTALSAHQLIDQWNAGTLEEVIRSAVEDAKSEKAE
jgi:hypothetical protein